MVIINWLNANQGFVICALTACYVIFTGWIIWEMRKERIERIRPNVIVDLIPKRIPQGYILTLLIKNIGNGLAKNISTSFNEVIKDLKDRDLNELGFVKNLKTLHSNQELSHFIDVSFNYFKKGKPTKITGQTTYQDGRGKTYRYPIDIDISVFEKFRAEAEGKTIHDLVKEIENLRGSVEKIAKKIKS